MNGDLEPKWSHFNVATLQALVCDCRRKKSVWTQRFSDFSKCLAWATEFPAPSWFHLWCPFTLARKLLEESAVQRRARNGLAQSSHAPGRGRPAGREGPEPAEVRMGMLPSAGPRPSWPRHAPCLSGVRSAGLHSGKTNGLTRHMADMRRLASAPELP